MIVHAFITRGDFYVIARHLRAYRQFCQRIIAVVDRSPVSEEICREHGADVIPWRGTERPDFNERGALMDEGAMRQAAWDAAMRYSPSLVVFGDTDEIPTPDIAGWLESDPDPAVEHWYCDWCHLWRDERHALGGVSSEWSFQNPRANKKGLVTRPIPGKDYRYRLADQHVRMEPSPLHEGRTVFDEAHRLAPVRLIHHKYASAEWLANPMRKLERFKRMAEGAEIVEVPAEWTAW
jgi:hypothetical protein